VTRFLHFLTLRLEHTQQGVSVTELLLDQAISIFFWGFILLHNTLLWFFSLKPNYLTVVIYVLMDRSVVLSGFVSFRFCPVAQLHDAPSFYSYNFQAVGNAAMKKFSRGRRGEWLHFSRLSPIFTRQWQGSEEQSLQKVGNYFLELHNIGSAAQVLHSELKSKLGS